MARNMSEQLHQDKLLPRVPSCKGEAFAHNQRRFKETVFAATRYWRQFAADASLLLGAIALHQEIWQWTRICY